MLIVNPPGARICEPSAGAGRIAGYMQAAGLEPVSMDLGLAAFYHFLEAPFEPADPWTEQAWHLRRRHVRDLTGFEIYSAPSRYAKAIGDLNRVLRRQGNAKKGEFSLANFRHATLSPLRRADLEYVYRNPEKSLFYPVFRAILEPLLPDHAEIGISISYLSQALPAFALCGWLSCHYPRCRRIVGGSLINSWLDAGICSRALLLEAFDEIGRGDGRNLSSLAQLDPRTPAPPSYHFPSETPYISPGRVVSWNAAFGCSWARCTFCAESLAEAPYSRLAEEIVSRELDALAEYKPALIHLTDNEIDAALLRHLIRKPPFAPWYGFCRVLPEMKDPDFCLALAAAGCVMLQIGQESGDQSVLNAMRKGIRVADSEIVLRNLHRAGIGTYVYMLFGTPQEKPKNAENSLAFLRRNAESIDYLNLSVFNLASHSPETGILETGSFYTGDMEMYRSFRHPHGWDRGAVRNFLAQDLGRIPEIRNIIKRTPPVFTSNHAPFLSPRLNPVYT